MRILHSSARALPIACFVALTALVVAVPIAVATQTEKVSTTTYVVTGSTEAELRASLDANRPKGYDARTNWYVTWSYTSAMRDGRCRVATSKVATKIVFTYPNWTAPEGTPEELTTKWSTYMSKLKVHESGHARIGRAVATRVQGSLNRARAATCAALTRALPSLVAPHYAWGNKADLDYDKRTEHGATQGAVFP